MDFWKSEYEEGNSTSSALAGLQELVDSPNVSRDSIEYSSDDPNSISSDPAEFPKVKQTLKATLLAKKRLQAYSSVNKFKSVNVKDETSSNEKPQRATFKKLKKTLYPDDAAKAVIRDIENLKRAGFGGPPILSSVLTTSVPADIIPVEPFVPISLGKLNIDKSPTISFCSDMDEENLFKKREIKCRNIRKSEITSRRSASPKNSTKNSKHENNSKKDRKEYPLNWIEYKEFNLDPQKDSLLKAKLFKKPRSKHFSLKKYFNFGLPSAPIEIYKCQPISGDAAWIPFPYIRSTASKPQILYSTNQHVTSPGYLTREQLFSIIPTERKLLIEKLWKTPSRCQPSNKKITTRKWYPRNWKKFDNTEAKLLEKSVGLSFLQSYSDGGEEEEEGLEDNNDETGVDKEVDLPERKVSTRPPATPKDYFKDAITAGISRHDERNTSLYVSEEDISAVVKTPPIEEKEEGEVSVEESLVNVSEDEYEKTKNELASLEEALKESTINYLDNIDKTFIQKDGKNTKDRKKKNKRSEKESKSKNKKNKSSRKIKKKLKDESEEDVDSSESEKISKKKKQKKKKKYFKDKTEKEKKRKAKKKRSKKKKVIHSNNESESSEVESDSEENIPKKNKNKKRKSINKLKRGHDTSEETNDKMQDRKNSVDITHEGYEDDVKYFTARFDKEDDLKGKIKYKKDDFDISGNIQNKNQTNIDLEELMIPSKSDSDKTIKRKSKWENHESDNLQNERNSEKLERKKYEIKVDLLKKNEEYLREQDKLKLKQNKAYCDNTGSNNPIKTTETFCRSEDENLGILKSQKLEKKNNYIQPLKSSIANEFKEKGRNKVIEKSKSPKKLSKDMEIIKSSDDDLNVIDKKDNKKNEIKKDNSVKHGESTESKVDNTKNKKDGIKDNTKIVDENSLTEGSVSGYQEKDGSKVQHQPDWEELKNKRKRHISDTAHEKIDKSKPHSSENKVTKNMQMFPLENELSIIRIKKEIDSDNEISINEQQQSKFKNLNTSWETDDEVLDVERRYGFDVERSLINLEIPLNIEHFTRREIKVENDNFDTVEEIGELPRDLIAERKKLEIEKEKVKELERELFQAQEKELQQKQQMKSGLKTKNDEKGATYEFEVQTPAKKRRWDIKSLDSIISTPKIKTEIIDLDANNSHNAVTLENEYEEFLKAVTSTKEDDMTKPIVIDSSTDSSITLNEGLKSKEEFEIGSNIVSEAAVNNNSPFKQVITNLDDLMPKPVETPLVDIPTLQIPLPPVKPEEMKPVPVPLPKLEAVFDLNKPLINLSLSANVTQNITLSLATSATSFSAPITSSIDISKTSVEISTPVSNETVVSMNNIPVPVGETVTSSNPVTNSSELILNQIQVPPKSKAILSSNIQPPKGETNFSKILSVESDRILDNTKSIDRELEKTRTKQKIVFATLTLPSKKQLINNSNLNLDDSDNDDQSIIEELKRKKLEALIEDNKKEVLSEEINKQVVVGEKIVNVPRAKSPFRNKHFSKHDTPGKTSPYKSSNSKRELSPRRKKESPVKKRDSSPKRRSPRRRSPRRSPRRKSPMRKRSPHRRRSPGRRSVSPRKRRSISPRKRRSPSPRRKRSISPKNRQSPRRNRSISPKNKNRNISPRSKPSRHSTSSRRSRSPDERKKSPIPPQISSPFGGLKRSVADSTISDDQLLQNTPHDDYGDTLFSNFLEKDREQEYDSPKRIPLDVRISQVLGYDIPNEASPKPTSSMTFSYDDHQQTYQFSEQYSSIQSQVTTPTMRNTSNNQGKRIPQSCYRQIGNMLQIVPNDDIIDIPMPQPPYQSKPSHLPQLIHQSVEQRPTNMDIKPQILQVGNMLQIVPSEIVPTEMIPIPPTETEVKIEKTEETVTECSFAITSPEKPSAEASMLQKIAERRAERENRRQDRERRRKEKEKRNKEKEKAKQARMKIKTENMIKKALEMEQEEDAEADTSGENPNQWPPLSIVVAHTVVKEAGKSILLTSSRKLDILPEERKTKIVQFADGIKPGEGTSPSAGEELSSPPPPKRKLPKEKRYKKMKFGKKSAKKKVKVKIIKKPPSPLVESDSDDNLPPPSPPPGSPPPHIYPPRIKVNPVNNVPAAYLATIIQNAQQQQHQQQIQRQQQQQPQQYQSNLYCPPINLLMAPPPPPQGHPPTPHHQSPAVPPAASPHGPQSHFHPSLAPPPPPPVSPHSHYSSSSCGQSGHHRHY